MVEHPDPSPIASFDGCDEMPDRTRRAFQSHADQRLDCVNETIAEIERVYRRSPAAVVACSGGKDSMTTLALAAQADCEHRALHFDWGRRFIPREVERSIVDAIREFVPDDRLYVASHERAQFELWPENDHFKANLNADAGGETYEGVSTLAGALRYCDAIGRQIVGLRADESGGRERKLEETGLFGESLGLPAAFPLREWSARDVWAYIVDQEVPYPDHYDQVAAVTDDGSPQAYEQARFTTFHDPEFEDVGGAAMSVAEWRSRQLAHQADE